MRLLQDRKGFIHPIILAALILLIITIFIITMIPRLFPQQKFPINMLTYEINPTTFKTTDSGRLTLIIKNLMKEKIGIVVYFETHRNVRIYLGDNLLQMQGNNYTYSKTFEPEEKSELIFTVKASLDVGDNTRNYYIKAYIYAAGSYVMTKEVSFTASRG